jgi:hypothetical protein
MVAHPGTHVKIRAHAPMQDGYGYTIIELLLIMLCGHVTFEMNGPHGHYEGICGYERDARVGATRADGAGVPPTVRLCAQRLIMPIRIEIRDRADRADIAKNIINPLMANVLHMLLLFFGTHSNFLTVAGVGRFFVLESMELQQFQRAIREGAPGLAAGQVPIVHGLLTLQDAYLDGAPARVREVMRLFDVRATEVVALDGRAFTVPVTDAAAFAAVCERYGLAYEAPPASPEERARRVADGALPRYVRVRFPGAQVTRAEAPALQLGVGNPIALLTQLNVLE